jgi:hypothetical protein
MTLCIIRRHQTELNWRQWKGIKVHNFISHFRYYLCNNTTHIFGEHCEISLLYFELVLNLDINMT